MSRSSRVANAVLCASLAIMSPALAEQAQASTPIKALYDFEGKSDGATPNGVLVADKKGNLYGTAALGGNSGCTSGLRAGKGCGVIFKLAPSGSESVLYAFDGGSDGADPVGGLLNDSSGNFYGVTAAGGVRKTSCSRGCGTVFKLTPGGTETRLYAFKSGRDGYGPAGSPIVDSTGNLFGTTVGGGSSTNCGSLAVGCGTVFKLTSGGVESVLHSFAGSGSSDGAYPAAGLVADGSGNLYGTTIAGGGTADCGTSWDGCGTIFKVTPAGAESVLYAFKGGSDGAYPGAGALIADTKGNFYGTTVAGGSSKDCGLGQYGCGTAFKLASNGALTILHTFQGGSDGAYPMSALVIDGSGNLYGTTAAGGYTGSCGFMLTKGSGCGVVFKIAPKGKETVLHAFKGRTNDGAYPVGLIADSSGNLDGTAGGGGVKSCDLGKAGKIGCGIVFTLKE